MKVFQTSFSKLHRSRQEDDRETSRLLGLTRGSHSSTTIRPRTITLNTKEPNRSLFNLSSLRSLDSMAYEGQRIKSIVDATIAFDDEEATFQSFSL